MASAISSVPVHHIADFPVRNKLREPADIGDDHGFVEMVGDLCHTALGGAFIWLNHQVGGAEIITHLAVGNEIIAQDHLGPSVLQSLDQFNSRVSGSQ